MSMKSYLADTLQFMVTRSSNKDHVKRITLNAKIFYILGLKCFRNDSYDSMYYLNVGNDLSENSIYSCKFGTGRPFESLLALSFEDGKLAVQDTVRRQLIAEDQIKNNAVYDICWVPNKPEIVSASARVGVDKWRITEGETCLTNVGSYHGHHKSVTTIDVNPWDPISFTSGSRDGNIIVWDSRCMPNQKATEINGAHYYTNQVNTRSRVKGRKGYSTVSVGSVAYVETNVLASIGTTDGCVKLWDLRKTYYNKGKKEPISLHTFKYPGSSSFKGYTSLSFSPSYNTIYVSCLDNNIYAYNLSFPVSNPANTFSGGKIASFFVKTCVSPCGSYLLCGSNNDTFIWLTDTTYNNTQPVLPVARLNAHTAEVTSVAWSKDGRDTVVTAGDDMTCLMFNVKHVDPNAEKDEYLLGDASPLHHLRLEKPLLNIKEDHVCHIRPVLEKLPDIYSDDPVKTTWHTHSNRPVPLRRIHSNSCHEVSTTRITWPSSYRNHSQVYTNSNNNCSTVQSKSTQTTAIPSCSGVQRQFTSSLTDVTVSPSCYNAQLQQLTYSPSCPVGKSNATTPRNSGPKPLFKTPKNTSEKQSMYSWMTMLRAAALQTTSPVHEGNATPDSTDRKKDGLKRKLSDFLGHNQENLLSEGEKQAKSPNKNILTAADNVSSKRAVKMLEYEESCDTKDTDDMEGIKPLDGSKLNQFMVRTNLCVFDIKTPVKSVIDCQTTLLTSPLSGLPNYVIDGTSPHNRPEKPVTRKRKEDWLTTLSASKKLKAQISSLDEETTAKKQK